MKRSFANYRRRSIGRVSTDTKGPPGLYMERSGLWDKTGLTD
jgi:hypothetical protein